MSELLPGSIADERFQRLDRVAAARFGGIDLTKLLVMLIDHVDASALPVLAWQFGALDEAWNLANETERRTLLKGTMVRRKRRGTAWAVRDALSALGYDSVVRENPALLHNGRVRRDGTFDYAVKRRFHFWVILAGGNHTRAELRGVVERWKRKSTRFQVYFVATLATASDPATYSIAPVATSGRTFDSTFDSTFG